MESIAEDVVPEKKDNGIFMDRQQSSLIDQDDQEESKNSDSGSDEAEGFGFSVD